MKLCKDCKHSDIRTAFDTCTRSVRVGEIDLRDGEKIMTGWRATWMERSHGRIVAWLTGACGKEGRFWEARP